MKQIVLHLDGQVHLAVAAICVALRYLAYPPCILFPISTVFFELSSLSMALAFTSQYCQLKIKL